MIVDRVAVIGKFLHMKAGALMWLVCLDWPGQNFSGT